MSPLWRKISGAKALVLVFALELLVFFFFRRDLEFIVAPLLFTFLGCWYLFYISKRPELLAKPEGKQTYAVAGYIWFLFPLLAIIILGWTSFLIVSYPLDIKNSDIIPLIKDVYVNRFLSGEPVYAPYTGYNYGTFIPNYMPFHWLPFALGEVLHIEPRMIHIGFFLLASGLMVFQSYKSSASQKEFVAKAVLPFFLVVLIFWKQPKDVANTVELLIASWYILLAYGFFSSNLFLQVIALGFTLFSRYSLLFWLPVYAYSKYLFKRKELLWGLMGILVFATLFYVLPFVWQTPEMLTRGANLWVDAALNEWDGQDWQPPGARPFQLYQGLGFASWFHSFYPGTLTQKLMASKNALILVSILASAFLMFYKWKQVGSENANREQEGMFLLLSLKFSLTLFFAFSFVPYVYLYWVSLALSVFILTRVRWDFVR